MDSEIRMLVRKYPKEQSEVIEWFNEVDRLASLGYLVRIRAGYYLLFGYQIERRTKEQDFTYDLGKWAVYDDKMNFFEVSYDTLNEAIQAVVEVNRWSTKM